MALYLNGKKLLNSLVIDGEIIKPLPEVLFAQSANRNALRTFSYTFTESGTFQYYVFIYSGSMPTSAYFSITLNSTTLTPIQSTYFFYGEVSANANDVLTLNTLTTEDNTGIQFFVFKNADITNFRLVGAAGNDNTTFVIDVTDSPYLQSYHYGYYNGNNSFHYQVVKCAVVADTDTNNKNISIATPNSSTYWYGGTWVIVL